MSYRTGAFPVESAELLMQPVIFSPIGVIHSPFKTPQGTPIQPGAAQGITGTVDLLPEYAAGLASLDGFSHVILLYHFHLARPFSLTVTPFMDDAPHGLFATRAPARPNAIGLSVVELVRIAGRTLHIRNVDIVDGTPLLDLKPYVPAFDTPANIRTGWLEKGVDDLPDKRDDGRFT